MNSSSSGEDLLILICVLAVFIFLCFIYMVFLCFECLKRKNNQPETGQSSWFSFLNIAQKGDIELGDVPKKTFSFTTQKPSSVCDEQYSLRESSIKSNYLDIVPQNRSLQKTLSLTQDSDTESQFSFNSEPERSRITLFSSPDALTCGSVTCSIKFYHFANRLAVRVGEVHLSLLENIIVSPYIKLHLIPEKKRGNRQTTKVKRNSAAFVCDEDFLFSVSSKEVRSKSLCLEIFDYKSSTRHLCIGKVVINLSEFDFKDEDKPMSLRRNIIAFHKPQEYFGALQLGVCVNPESIMIRIIKAESLVPVDMSGTLDPYVRVLFHVGTELITKKKTGIVPGNRCPIWEEVFTLEIPPSTLLCDISLTFEIRDQLHNSRHSSFLLLGRVVLSTSAEGPGRTHWEHLSSKRGTTVTEWQPILP